jgi:hypothetical protein
VPRHHRHLQKTPRRPACPIPRGSGGRGQKRGPTSRKTCGDCHFNGGGGEAVKHADLSRQLLSRSATATCTWAATISVHRVPPHPQPQDRRAQLFGARGGRQHSCENCHSDTPHYGDDLLDHHLNKHSDNIACTTCHAPVYAKCKPTKTFWDWSKAGDKKRKPKKDKYGMKDYNWKKGEFIWKESAKPVYRWYGGFMKRVLLGDKLDLDPGRNQHLRTGGLHQRPQLQNRALQDHGGGPGRGRRVRHLLVPHLFPREQGRQDRLLETPRLAKGLHRRDEGRRDEVQRQVRMDPHQHVLGRRARGHAGRTWPCPASSATKACKGERTCNRCHQDSRDVDFKKIAHKGTDFTWPTWPPRAGDV